MRGLVRGIVVVGAVVVGGRAVVNSSVSRAKESGQLRVKEVQVRGNRALSEAEIRAVSGVKAGQGLLTVSPEEVAAKLRAHPAVADAGVRRVLPATLILSIKERIPVALALGHGELLAVDEGGAVFPAGKNIFRMALPVVRGLPVGGNRAAPPAWQDCFMALEEAERVALDVSELIWEKDEVALMTLDGDRVRMVPGDVRVLSRVKWVLDKERSLGRRALVLDARAEGMVTVRDGGTSFNEGGGS